MNLPSPDIQVLDFDLLFDLSSANPTVVVTNRSEGDNLAAVNTAFQITSPNGIIIHSADVQTDPDKVGLWTTFSVALPLIGNQIEWDGKGYTVEVTVKDSTAAVYSLAKNQAIGQPNGNKQLNTFGMMKLDYSVKCDQAKLYIQDISNYTYQKLQGIEIAKKVTLRYPGTDPDNTPAPFTRNNSFSTLQVPLLVNGDGHQLLAECIRDYVVADTISIRIKYVFKATFNVQCYVDMCAVLGAVRKFEEQLGSACCDADREKLLLVNTKLALIEGAKMQPGCGIDVQRLVKEIEELIGFDIRCSVNTGIFPMENIGVTPPDPLTVLNNLLNQLDPKCITSVENWTSATVLLKFQMLINKICNPGCDNPVITQGTIE
jgi:hypothetical protein